MSPRIQPSRLSLEEFRLYIGQTINFPSKHKKIIIIYSKAEITPSPMFPTYQIMGIYLLPPNSLEGQRFGLYFPAIMTFTMTTYTATKDLIHYSACYT